MFYPAVCFPGLVLCRYGFIPSISWSNYFMTHSSKEVNTGPVRKLENMDKQICMNLYLPSCLAYSSLWVVEAK